jgi:hypothetical protein
MIVEINQKSKEKKVIERDSILLAVVGCMGFLCIFILLMYFPSAGWQRNC